ncbi:MAG: L,D-transpeptidase family protein [Pseudomonadota bacterium]
MSEPLVTVDIARQRLRLERGAEVVMDVAVSTALNGVGEQEGSGCTPRGWHVIRARIGAGCPVNSVFVGRRPTGEIYTPELAREHPGRDWILSRILWLSGLERGKNRLGRVDTMRRYIYLHGCPDAFPMGEPRSHGCVRMRNSDIIALFDRVSVGTRVFIDAGQQRERAV